MAFVKVQDETEVISCTFFPRQYTTYGADLNEGSLILVEGTVEKRKGIAQVLVQTMRKLDELN